MEAFLTNKIHSVSLLVLGLAVLSLVKVTSANEALSESFYGNSFSVYVLSRGKGVPDPALMVLKEVQQMLKSLQGEGVEIRIVEERIGIEGEIRLCAEFIDEEIAHTTWQRVKVIGSGVDLVNLRIEACPR